MSDHPIEYRDPRSDLAYPAQPDTGYPFGGGRGLDDDEEEGGANLQRYLAAVLRFKWLILLITLVGGVLGVLLSRSVTPQYQAEATLWMQAAPRSSSYIASKKATSRVPTVSQL